MVDAHQSLTDSQWQVIEPLLPIHRKRRHCLRQMLDAMFYICRTGCQWRNLPTCFPPWSEVYYYFARWRANGTFERLSQASNRADRLAQGRLPTPSPALVDAQSIKLAPRLGQQRGLDAHKRVNGRKRQLLCDTGGRIWRASWCTVVRRWVVERTFAWLNCFRRVVMDYERLPTSQAAWLFVANLTMFLRRATSC